ncbi:hypothetical protein EVAR_599_1 [Eumeta japonica]|uniref:Uncharacterized protein n=1 Tax=Eumeta variegata TaxID=151549 RepID=A0A4C1SB28_EUMVA|nr:hypothetical protein EVAR_599_1 [Eumeta japonica]
MSSRRVVKGASLSKSERDGNVPALTKGAQKPMAATKKSVKQQKTELTPPSEKAPQNSGRAGTRRPLPRRSRRRPQRACIGSLTISPPKLLVEVEPMDKIAALGKETDAGVFTAIQAVGDFARRASLREEIGRPSLSGAGGPRPSDLSGGTPRCESRGSTPVGVHPINRVASAIGPWGRRASSKEMLGQMRVPEALAEIRKVVARPAPRIMNYAEAAAKPRQRPPPRRPWPSTRLGTGHTLIVASI